MATGTVKKLVSERGFGFITSDEGKDYFFHRSVLSPSLDFDRLAGGERVRFEIEQDPKGERAERGGGVRRARARAAASPRASGAQRRSRP